jgi:hypothetical protein
MYSFAQRSDTRVVDEPLYGHYLRISGAMHPGRDEILLNMETNGGKVVTDVILGEFEEDILFLKQMTHHLVEIDTSFLEDVINVFLIRDPYQLIGSFHQVIPDVDMTDIGVEKQFLLYNDLISKNLQPIVIDSGEILKSPKVVLAEFCRRMEIDFQETMLNWEAGPRPEDGIWAKHWYSNVHKSTGFEKQQTSSRQLPDELMPLYNKCKFYYEQLYNHSIKA